MIDNQLQDDFSMQRRDNFLEKHQTVLSDSLEQIRVLQRFIFQMEWL